MDENIKNTKVLDLVKLSFLFLKENFVKLANAFVLPLIFYLSGGFLFLKSVMSVASGGASGGAFVIAIIISLVLFLLGFLLYPISLATAYYIAKGEKKIIKALKNLIKKDYGKYFRILGLSLLWGLTIHITNSVIKIFIPVDEIVESFAIGIISPGAISLVLIYFTIVSLWGFFLFLTYIYSIYSVLSGKKIINSIKEALHLAKKTYVKYLLASSLIILIFVPLIIVWFVAGILLEKVTGGLVSFLLMFVFAQVFYALVIIYSVLGSFVLPVVLYFTGKNEDLKVEEKISNTKFALITLAYSIWIFILTTAGFVLMKLPELLSIYYS